MKSSNTSLPPHAPPPPTRSPCVASGRAQLWSPADSCAWWLVPRLPRSLFTLVGGRRRSQEEENRKGNLVTKVWAFENGSP
jgi:hypothetical protein